jgi:hypothetical protein
VVVLAAALLAVWLWPDEAEPRAAAPTPVPSFALLPIPSQCPSTRVKPFEPTSLAVPGVDTHVKVLALPRDARDVPSTPPVSAVGKREVAWDRPPGILPGSPRGNVLLNAHTFPDGSALGNDLLKDLQKGDLLRLSNASTKLCYRVTERVEVEAAGGFPRYYERDGVPQVALIVCSGRRLGPGEWTHRTIWFAEPWTDAT